MSLNPSYPDAIYPLLQCINETVQPPCPTSADNNCNPFKSEASRRKLIAAAEQLLLAARSPEENVFAIAQQVRIYIHTQVQYILKYMHTYMHACILPINPHKHKLLG